MFDHTKPLDYLLAYKMIVDEGEMISSILPYHRNFELVF